MNIFYKKKPAAVPPLHLSEWDYNITCIRAKITGVAR